MNEQVSNGCIVNVDVLLAYTNVVFVNVFLEFANVAVIGIPLAMNCALISAPVFAPVFPITAVNVITVCTDWP